MANDTFQRAIGMTLPNGVDVDFGDEATATLAAANAQDLDMVKAWMRDTWEGRNILEVPELAAEIAKEANWVAWIKKRIAAHDYSGLMLRDWIPITLSDGVVMPYAIGRFDGTLGAGDQEETEGSIDFVPAMAYPTAVQFNTTYTNQGTAAKPNPYCASHLHEWELNTYLPMLPTEVKGALKNYRVIAESRYQAGQTLNESTNREWTDLGKIWSLSEMEVYGCTVWGTRGFSTGIDTPFPIFKQTKDLVRRSAADGVTRRYWWLRVVESGNSTSACAVGEYGHYSHVPTPDTNVFPLPCFRF